MKGKRLTVLLLSTMMTFFMVPLAIGGNVLINHYANYYDNEDTSYGGGEFTLTPKTGFPVTNVLNLYSSSAQYNGGFQSFCLERNEYITMKGEYIATLNTGAVAGGTGGATNGFDPLSKGSAYLYYSFATGTLGLYQYTPGEAREQSAKDLQNAIWLLEGESGYLTSAYSTLLINTFGSVEAAKADNNLYHVGVLNLTDSDGGKHQDQLVLTPEPASILLLGIGFLGMVAFTRKFRRS